MIKYINQEEPFQAQGDRFSVDPTTSGYQIAYSTDGVNYALDEEAVVEADDNLIYIGAMEGVYYMLSGNTDDNVKINI